MKANIELKTFCLFLALLPLGLWADESLDRACVAELKALPNGPKLEILEKLCSNAQQLKRCTSVEERPIFHFDFAKSRMSGRNILVLAIIHGDEVESGTIALRWMERLTNLNSRNRWRILPILNPDGLRKRQRTNAHGVDLNRNFPTKDWADRAIAHWEKNKGKDPRRYPGPNAASEIETKCAMDHMELFRPDFIIAVHTPYGVLDFDGPAVDFPKYAHLPWRTLGTFPGSLGRYMWKDQNVPVLTIELKNSKLLAEIDQIDLLQDISGTVAIRANRKLKK